MAIIIVEPQKIHQAGVEAYKRAFMDIGETMHGCGDLDKLTFDEWLDSSKTNQTNPPTGYVSATQYLAIEESSSRVVGFIQLRHELNDYLLNFGGHIGYSVHPGERGNGYATKMLALCLVKARELNIRKVLITCSHDNDASAKIIQKCGGQLEDTRTDVHGKRYQRYWIATG